MPVLDMFSGEEGNFDIVAGLFSDVRGKSDLREKGLVREHFGEYGQCGLADPFGDLSESPDQTHPVDRAQLVEDDLSGLALEPARYARRIDPALGCHRRDNHRGDMAIHLIRRHHEVRPSLLDFSADGGARIFGADGIPYG